MEKQIIPIFFSIDDNYAPYFKIALKSIMENSNPNNEYRIYVLYSNMSENTIDGIKAILKDNFICEFVDMNPQLQEISDKLFTRDYYSKTTYYRLFIPNMFPQYDKAIYVDADIAVNSDIANFYNQDIGTNLLGAIPDESVQIVDEFIAYVEKYLGVKHENYFNAGVIVMNLKELRNFNFEEKFLSLLGQIKFPVAQDQDYLNVICKDKIKYLPLSWNKQPFKKDGYSLDNIDLVHYNLSFKPWHYDNIEYQELFHRFANEINLTDFIKNNIDNYTDENKKKDVLCGENLRKMAYEFSEVEDTFAKLLESGKITI